MSQPVYPNLVNLDGDPLHPYSFRAECQADFDAFVKRIGELGLEMSLVHVQRDAPTGEVVAEVAALYSLDFMRSVIRDITDGHVMLQTLRPMFLADNNCERDYTVV